MAGRLVPLPIRAPGFWGLNTEQEAAALQPNWATTLSNAVFDASARMGARKGYEVLTASSIDNVDKVFFWRKDRANSHIIVAGTDTTDKFFDMTSSFSVFTDITGSLTPSTTDFKFVNCNGFAVGVAQGETPIQWNGTGNFANFAAASGATANPTGNVAHSAFGRLFISSADAKTLYGSGLQPNPSTGINWDNWFYDTTGASGTGRAGGWTIGRDYIVAVSSVDEYLCLFGRNAILVLADIDDSTNGPILHSVVNGVGCAARDSVREVGDDVVFLSDTGIRSLRRTLIYEQSPVGDLSVFNRTKIVDELDTGTVGAVYDPIEGMYVIFQGTESYYLDTKNPLDNGSWRTSEWDLAIRSADYNTDDRLTYMGIGGDLCTYGSYNDDDQPYLFQYRSGWLSWDNENIKIGKRISAIVAGGASTNPRFLWAWDFNENSLQGYTVDALPEATGSEWGQAEYGANGLIDKDDATKGGPAEYGETSALLVQTTAPIDGEGEYLQIGLEVNINGSSFGIQQIKPSVKRGRVAA